MTSDFALEVDKYPQKYPKAQIVQNTVHVFCLALLTIHLVHSATYIGLWTNNANALVEMHIIAWKQHPVFLGRMWLPWEWSEQILQ